MRFGKRAGILTNPSGYPDLALAEVEKIERFLTALPDSPAVYSEWKRLVVRHGVGIRRILPFHTGDFTRYEIDAIHPSSLLT